MARMIPPYIHKSAPPGERLLFDRLKNDPNTANWAVLHSLGVARHVERVEGEVDFLVLVPNEGVLCLEIKSGKVRREDGVWKYGNDPFPITSKIGPFRQASEGMHSIRKFVVQNEPSLSKILFFSGVVFTLIDFDEVSPEWHRWQYVDRSKIARSPVSGILVEMLRSARRHFQNVPSAKWFNDRTCRPSQNQVDRMVGLLRPDFECFVSPRMEIDEAEKAISRFTEEQFAALDVLDENPRILFKGPAGSGKTFLALEASRRSIGKENRTLLICYNKLLGKWLSAQTEELRKFDGGLLKVGTFHQVMLSLSGVDSVPDNDPAFWSKTLPDTVLNRILQGDIPSPQFESLIIDEAQDLISEEYLDVFDLLLVGGLAGGHWAFFGDFERQAIYARSQRDGVDTIIPMVEGRCPSFFRYPLRNNCRNSKPIAIGIETTCGLQPGYARVLNEDDSNRDIEFKFYGTQQDQLRLLESTLETLKKDYEPSEMVVLSPRDDKSSCSAISSERLSLEPLRGNKSNDKAVGYSSIHSFKGLEASAVVITDMENIRGDKALELLYVGMSRARTRLIVFFNESCRNDYLEVVMNGLLKRKTSGGV